ncbi:MAG: hypothetical protein ACTHXA_12440 [Gulosibacter sp.]|uniref:hypothetical protein n=1 Tax=Gulosibacter sp. TaxID=2817531 RepID=UPI003F8E649B
MSSRATVTENLYARFLPEARQEIAAAFPPEITCWRWREHEIRILRARRPESAARVLVVHGAGAHGEALWPLATLAAGPISRIKIPMHWLANLSKMSRDPELSRLCASDPQGGATRVPIGFLTSFLQFRHARPEYSRTPVALLHPAEDAWTPPSLSTRFLERIGAPTELIMLRECGHFPVEEPGLGELIAAVSKAASRT